MALGDFFSMDGYAAYVWPCFVLTLAVLAWNVFAARRAHALALASARRRLAIDASREDA